MATLQPLISSLPNFSTTRFIISAVGSDTSIAQALISFEDWNMRSLKILGSLGAVFGFAVVLLSWCAIAQAHTHLLKSVPAEGRVVGTAPASVMLTFSEAARLTAAWIQKGAAGVKTKLTLPEGAATEITITLPALTPGTYLVSWRAASADGHVMPGRIRFTVSPVPASQAAQH